MTLPEIDRVILTEKDFMKYYLAQANIAKLKFPLDHPNSKDFKENLDRINDIADKSPGFIWRLKDEDGGASSNIVAYTDPLVIVNASVWETVEDLINYVYKSEHFEYFNRRKEWFERMNGSHLALWWTQEGDYPTVFVIKEKLAMLDKYGPTQGSFRFARIFQSPPG